jgi:hypothetical protein
MERKEEEERKNPVISHVITLASSAGTENALKTEAATTLPRTS